MDVSFCTEMFQKQFQKVHIFAKLSSRPFDQSAKICLWFKMFGKKKLIIFFIYKTIAMEIGETLRAFQSEMVLEQYMYEHGDLADWLQQFMPDSNASESSRTLKTFRYHQFFLLFLILLSTSKFNPQSQNIFYHVSVGC